MNKWKAEQGRGKEKKKIRKKKSEKKKNQKKTIFYVSNNLWLRRV